MDNSSKSPNRLTYSSTNPNVLTQEQINVEFQSVLSERLQKQESWVRTYQELPKISENSQGYRELCQGLIPQEDFFVEQLQDITEQFHGHTLTKMSKKLKQENLQLEKQKQDLAVEIEHLKEKNDRQSVQLQEITSQLESSLRASKLATLQLEKLTLENQSLKQQNELLLAQLQDATRQLKSNLAHQRSISQSPIVAKQQVNQDSSKLFVEDNARRLQSNPSAGSFQSQLIIEKEEPDKNQLPLDALSDGTVKYDKEYYDGRIVIYQNEIKSLKEKLNEYEEQTQSLEKEIEQLVQSNSGLLNQLQTQALQHRETVSMLEMDMNELRKKVDSNSNSIPQYLQDQNSQTTSIQDQIVQLKQQVSEKDKDLAEKDIYIKQINQKWDNLAQLILQTTTNDLSYEKRYQKIVKQFQILEGSQRYDQDPVQNQQRLNLTPSNQFSKLNREMDQDLQAFSSPNQQIHQRQSNHSSPLDNYLNSYSAHNQSSGKQVTFKSRLSDELQQQLSFEQETIYLNMIKNKDEEIKYLKDELKKCESYRPQSHRQNASPSPLRMPNDSQVHLNAEREAFEKELDQLKQAHQNLQQENQQILSDIQRLQAQNKVIKSQSEQQQLVNDHQLNQKLQTMNNHLQMKQKEIDDLNKDKELTQKIIASLEVQLKESNTQFKKLQDQREKDKQSVKQDESRFIKTTNIKQKEIEQLQKQLSFEREQVKNLQIQNDQLDQALKFNHVNQPPALCYSHQQQSQDQGEINFYLAEMKQVKERIVQNIYDIKSNITHQRLTLNNFDDFTLDFQVQTEAMESNAIEPRSIVFMAKDLVRRELEHLLILNSFSLELQQYSFTFNQQQSHKNLIENQQVQKLEMERKEQIDKLKERLLQLIDISYEVELDYRIEDLVEVLSDNFSSVRRENDQLNLQNSNNELKLQTILNDLELLKDANSQLQSELKILRQEDSTKVKQLESQMMDKIKVERGKNLALMEENEDLASRNKNMQEEIGKLLMRVEELESQNKELSKDCQILQTKINLMNERQQTQDELQSNVEKLKIQHIMSTKKIKERLTDSQSSSHQRKRSHLNDKYVDKSNERMNVNQKFMLKTGDPIFTDTDQESLFSNRLKESQQQVKRGEDNEKINFLIEEYRRENEKCAQKIHDLQKKLKQSQTIIGSYDPPQSSKQVQSSTREYSHNQQVEKSSDYGYVDKYSQKMHIQTLNQTYLPQNNYHSMRLSPQIDSYAVQTPNSNHTYQGNQSHMDNMSSYYVSPRELINRDQSLYQQASITSKPTSLRQGALIARNTSSNHQNAGQSYSSSTVNRSNKDPSGQATPVSSMNQKKSQYYEKQNSNAPQIKQDSLQNSSQKQNHFFAVSLSNPSHSFVSGTGSSGSGFKKYSTRSKQASGPAQVAQFSSQQFSKSFDNTGGGSYQTSNQKKLKLAAANTIQAPYISNTQTHPDQDYEYLGNLNNNHPMSPRILNTMNSQGMQIGRSDILSQFGDYEKELSKERSSARPISNLNISQPKIQRNRNEQSYGAIIQQTENCQNRRTGNDRLTESRYTFGLNGANNQ